MASAYIDGLKMRELSRYLMVTGGNVTGLTDELEGEGLVQRVSSETDRRAWIEGLRKDIETIITKLGRFKPALHDLALTTNGYFLPERAQSLKDAGLDRVTISLDSLKRDIFKRMTGVDVLDKVLAGIAAAKRAGLEPIKINAVIVRGHNEDEVADFVDRVNRDDVWMR